MPGMNNISSMEPMVMQSKETKLVIFGIKLHPDIYRISDNASKYKFSLSLSLSLSS